MHFLYSNQEVQDIVQQQLPVFGPLYSIHYLDAHMQSAGCSVVDHVIDIKIIVMHAWAGLPIKLRPQPYY